MHHRGSPSPQHVFVFRPRCPLLCLSCCGVVVLRAASLSATITFSGLLPGSLHTYTSRHMRKHLHYSSTDTHEHRDTCGTQRYKDMDTHPGTSEESGDAACCRLSSRQEQKTLVKGPPTSPLRQRCDTSGSLIPDTDGSRHTTTRRCMYVKGKKVLQCVHIVLYVCVCVRCPSGQYNMPADQSFMCCLLSAARRLIAFPRAPLAYVYVSTILWPLHLEVWGKRCLA